MRLRLLAVLALAGLLLAGCSGQDPASSTTAATTANGTPAGTATDGDGTTEPVPPGATLIVTFDGPVELGVPFPHLDRCVAPQDWAAGTATANNATWTLRTVNRGTLLWVAATAAGKVELEVDLAAKPKCQTLRHDPWSIDPDPEDDKVVEAQGGSGSAHVVVLVHHRDGHCMSVTAYNGTVEGGAWATLRSPSAPEPCA